MVGLWRPWEEAVSELVQKMEGIREGMKRRSRPMAGRIHKV